MGDVIRKIEDIEAEMARSVKSINETKKLNGCSYSVSQKTGEICMHSKFLFFRLLPIFVCFCKCHMTLFLSLDQTGINSSKLLNAHFEEISFFMDMDLVGHSMLSSFWF